MKSKAEVTLESAIVVPSIMLIIVFMIYVTFSIHDVLVLKSYAYAAAVESNGKDIDSFFNEVATKVSKAPTLVMRATIKCYKEGENYVIEMDGIPIGESSVIGAIIKERKIQIKIQEKMNTESIHFINGVLDLTEKEQ